jgi:AbrB family looped-hinge helix DNA binding protein
MRELLAAVTSNGQGTIPSEVRRHLGVATPDQVAFVVDDDGRVELRPARFTLEAIRGIVPPLPGRETIDFEDQIEEAMEAEAERIVRRLDGR